ncbi:MAG: tyrosine-type recombinase/integrase [Bryobacterales bacterium]|nr:tyrosine-type recombinase/integrase [Bryobacterales bacterium]
MPAAQDLIFTAPLDSAVPSVTPASSPARLFLTTETGTRRFWEFFTVHIRNPHTRRAYFHAASLFSDWCIGRQLALAAVEPVHVAAYIESLTASHSKPTVKQHLAAIRMLFDWLVVGQILPRNPAHAVRGPRYSVKQGKTPVLSAGEMRLLLDSIPIRGQDGEPLLIGLRDRALIALMGYTFARVGPVMQMKVSDYYVQKRRGWVRLQEKGGKINDLPCHHNLEQYLEEWLSESGLSRLPHAPLFPAMRQGKLSSHQRHLSQGNIYFMIQRRARQAGIQTRIGCHSFRATGITTYLQNGGKLEVAQRMAGHESARTTGLYDRRNDSVALDEVERVVY